MLIDTRKAKQRVGSSTSLEIVHYFSRK